MFVKQVTYTDFNGETRIENCRFNLTEAELTQMVVESEGGLDKRLERLLERKDTPALMEFTKDLIHRSYGEISPDGRRFIKVDPVTKVCLADEFEQTEAYSKIFMDLMNDHNFTSEFIRNVVPKKMAEKLPSMEAAIKDSPYFTPEQKTALIETQGTISNA